MTPILVKEFAINIIVQTYALFMKYLSCFVGFIVISGIMVYVPTRAYRLGLSEKKSSRFLVVHKNKTIRTLI